MGLFDRLIKQPQIDVALKQQLLSRGKIGRIKELEKPAKTTAGFFVEGVKDLGQRLFSLGKEKVRTAVKGEGDVTIGEFGKEFGKVSKDFIVESLRAIPRAATSLGLEAETRIGKVPLISRGREEITPKTPIQKFLLGDEPVQRAEKVGETALLALGASKGDAKKNALVFGLSLGTLDAVTGGKSKVAGISKNISKTTDPLAIAKNLKQVIKASDDKIASFSDMLVKVDKEKDIEFFIRNIIEPSDKIEAKPFLAKKVEPIPTKVKPKKLKEIRTVQAETLELKRFRSDAIKRKIDDPEFQNKIATLEIKKEIADTFKQSTNFEDVLKGIKSSPTFKKEKIIADIQGESWLMRKDGKVVIPKASEVNDFVAKGWTKDIEIDSLAQEAGFDNGFKYLNNVLDVSTEPSKIDIRVLAKQDLEATDDIFKSAQEKLVENRKILTEEKITGVRAEAIREIGRKEKEVERVKVRKEKERVKLTDKLKQFNQRKMSVRAVKDFFKISDSDFKKIGGRRDVQSMSIAEFDGFMNKLRHLAEETEARTIGRAQLEATIRQKELQKTDNLRKALKLPEIHNMNQLQLKGFDEILNTFQQGDEFLTLRKLETVDKTDLKGIKTVREGRERLAKELKAPIEELNNIKVKLDRLRFDTALAEKNDFYRWMVDETNKEVLNAEARFLNFETDFNDLINKARKSRKLTVKEKIKQRIAPTDENIVKWLETEDKTDLLKIMTKEEIEAAEFARDYFAQARDYLSRVYGMNNFKDYYYNHIRKGFLETAQEDGLLQALKAIAKEQVDDKATFTILDRDTGNILPLEKFFQFSLKRTGGIDPTKNVAKAVSAYAKTFEKKKGLDALIPKTDIYTYILSPKALTPRGLEMDRTLKTFVNEWLNNKKGRQATVLFSQGSAPDIALKMANSFLSFLWLGFNFSTQLASPIGEHVFNIQGLGKDWLKGVKRQNTKQGKKIVEANRAFIGKSIWQDLSEAADDAGNKLFKTMFLGFKVAQVNANKTFLLGRLTKEEFKTGIISPQRLAEIKRDMGRFRVVEDGKSIYGSTSFGKMATKFKTWMIPPLRTTSSNFAKAIKSLKSKKAEKLTPQEAGELRRVIVTGGIVLYSYMATKDYEDKSFIGNLKTKAIRESMSLYGSLNPVNFLSVPPLLSFLDRIGKSIDSIIKLEEYKVSRSGEFQKGELKGVKSLQRLFTPTAVKQFKTEEKKTPKKSAFKRLKTTKAVSKKKTSKTTFKRLKTTKEKI